MSVQALFQTYFWTSKIPSASRLTKQLSIEALGLEEEDRAGRKWSEKNYFGGYTSYGTVADLPRRSSNIERLKNWIDLEVGRFSRKLDWDLRNGRLEMSSCWFNVMREGCQHSFHIHPLSVLSGTFYIQVPKGSGGFKIEDPRLAFMMGAPPRKLTGRAGHQPHWEHRPSAGELVLFESWVRHEVPAFRGPGERISMSFNYDWVRS